MSEGENNQLRAADKCSGRHAVETTEEESVDDEGAGNADDDEDEDEDGDADEVEVENDVEVDVC
jgi:hypothetical protein